MKLNINLNALSDVIFALININQLELARKCIDIINNEPEVKPASVLSKDEKPKKKRGVAKGRKWTPEQHAKRKATSAAKKQKQQENQAQPEFPPLQV